MQKRRDPRRTAHRSANRLIWHSTDCVINRLARGRFRLPIVSERFVPGLSSGSPAHELWALVVESSQVWTARVTEAATAAGLSPASLWALIQLDPQSPISQKALAARLHCNPSTVVDPTDRLEDCGLVIRQGQPGDRRVKVLFVTALGKSVREEALDRLFEPPRAFGRLSLENQIRFRDAMLEAVLDGHLSGPVGDRTPTT